jgi:hypothetical protein
VDTLIDICRARRSNKNGGRKGRRINYRQRIDWDLNGAR